MKNILLGWLAAQGISLANDASDQAIVTAVQKLATANTQQAAALGNEKTALAGTITTLT